MWSYSTKVLISVKRKHAHDPLIYECEDFLLCCKSEQQRAHKIFAIHKGNRDKSVEAVKRFSTKRGDKKLKTRSAEKWSNA